MYNTRYMFEANRTYRIIDMFGAPRARHAIFIPVLLLVIVAELVALAPFTLSGSAERLFSGKSSTISITSPKAYQVLQRGADDTADIAISGTYSGTPEAIEASWNGGAWETIVSEPSGGTYSGVLVSQKAGQGNLRVRFADNVEVSASNAYVGVGDIYVVAGQSNASGRGFNSQSYTHASLNASLFGNDGQWKRLTDPTDSNTNQVDGVSADSYAAGSPWPLLATSILADQSVPVAFVVAPKGGTSIYQWQKNSDGSVSPSDRTPYSSCSTALDASGLYGNMKRQIDGAGGKIKAVLFFQGEQDARNVLETSQESYEGYLNCFIDNVYADFGAPTVSGMIHIYAGKATASALDTIRAAQKAVWDENEHAIAGPVMVDVDVTAGDGVHFMTNSEIQIFANRWWAALKNNLYGGTDDGRGPRIQSAQYNQEKTELILSFADDSGLSAGSVSVRVFSVVDERSPIAVVRVERLSATQLSLTLSRAASGSITVSLASGSAGIRGKMPYDASAFSLPAEPFTVVATP